jgi:hypothetical protein
MRTPHVGEMPNGGARHYGGIPSFGVWEKTCGRFVTVIDGRTYKIHRLVCEAFHGPPDEASLICIHLDENAANNRPNNLSWGTQKQNLNGAAFKEYCKNRVGEYSPYEKSMRLRCVE